MVTLLFYQVKINKGNLLVVTPSLLCFTTNACHCAVTFTSITDQ